MWRQWPRHGLPVRRRLIQLDRPRRVVQAGYHALGVFGVLAIALLPAVSACGLDDSIRTPGAFTITDSAGVVVAVTPANEARQPLPWTVRQEPDLVVGMAEGPAGPLFRVRGVAGTAAGDVVVMNAGSSELIVLDSSGRLAERRGGRGEGPGEYLEPTLVPSFAQDSLLVFDQGSSRLHLMAESGGVDTTIIPSHWPAGRRAPVGHVALHMLVERASIVGGEGALQSMGVGQLQYEYLWFDVVTEREVFLEAFDVAWRYQAPTWEVPMPFSSRPSAVVTDSRAAITAGSAPEIRLYDRWGHVRRILRVDEPSHDVSPQMIRTYVDQQTSASVAGSLGDWMRDYDQIPIPDILPWFQSLLVDEDGRLWAELYRWRGSVEPQWMVFDVDGRARGVVSTPRGVDVQYIGADYILGVRRDRMDVEYVQRHRVIKGGDGG